ncbi:MAG TPA: biopolymer transporter ExbD [Hyphomicrobiaceae bacterium]|nr:biopolymer transporter ExbD [Hyphomicrobiaceae bacterium]
MGASIKMDSGGGRRRGRRGKRAVMSEINVTPMVDVMLVLLIIFMVAAPLLQVGVPVELPEAKGRQLAAKKQDPVVITVQTNGDIFIGETKVALDEVAAKLKGIAKNGYDDTIFVKGDRGANYGAVLKVMGRIVEGGFTKVSFVSELEQGG